MFKITYAGDTVIGEKHIQNNQVCEDANKVYQDNDVLIIAIADGHGSNQYEYSNIGSQKACDLIVDILKNNSSRENLLSIIEDELITQFVDNWEEECLSYYNQISNDTFSRHEVIEKFGTTCLFMIIQDNKIIIGKIGDGNVFINSNGIHYPFGEDYEHSNITKSLISDDASEEFEIMELELERGVIVLSTDGHVNSFASKEAFEKHLNTLASLVINHGINPIKEELKHLLTKISKDGCGDDITMFVVNVEEIC